ncbi:hypothetical protein [Bosea sp. NBC_00550]|uniref:hypothetical protein n=1 Tax=Bosea sp. NBC_00550 TaxID=2969621 RepID=UPI00223064AF|nr:hypothetical protein [Bosea sp. NBC_00550]UZF94527.1 hypothetical protein NWE53_10300 [Bosea sp. NBC_00550]
MRRIAAFACLLAVAALLPIQAEAARFRSGRGGSAPATKTSHSIVVVPGAAGIAGAKAAEAGQPERAPFPASGAPREEPVLLRLTANEGAQKPWCRTDVVVGGFCILN